MCLETWGYRGVPDIQDTGVPPAFLPEMYPSQCFYQGSRGKKFPTSPVLLQPLFSRNTLLPSKDSLHETLDTQIPTLLFDLFQGCLRPTTTYHPSCDGEGAVLGRG